MLRRQARERRAYLHRKALAAKSNIAHLRKLKAHIDKDKELPKELRDPSLRKDLRYDEARLMIDDAEQMDDEYYSMGMREPRILITTSRDPSSRLLQFSKVFTFLLVIGVDWQEIRLVFPNSTWINRGTHVIDDIAKACRTKEFTDLVILHEHCGQPDELIISHFPHGPTAFFSLHNVSLRHDIPDIGTAPQAYPHLIFHNLTSNLGQRLTKILQALFPVPLDVAKASQKGVRTVTFANEEDFVSFRHHLGIRTGEKEVQLSEVGPRFEMRLFEIRLGTAEMGNADVEWRLAPYQRRGRKEILSAN